MKTVSIVAQNVTKSFGRGSAKRNVLCGISATFHRGQTYSIAGVSGTGKSTLIHLLAGLDNPTQGDIFFDGCSLLSMSRQEKRIFLSKSIGLVFQSPHLLSELSVVENVALPAMIAGVGRSIACKKAKKFLDMVGLSSFLQEHPKSLSGGQQQRVALCRAIMNEPIFLLADELTGNLDVETGKQIIDLLCRCNKTWGMGIIIASHDEYVSKSMQHRLVLSSGVFNDF